MEAVLWVALGSAFGGMARYGVSGLVGRRIGETFPWGTMAVNVSGAFAIGLAAAAALSGSAWLAGPVAWHFAVVGFLGSYTTVSSVSLQTLSLAQEGRLWPAAGNVALSLALCLGAAAVGLATGAIVLGSR